MLSADDDVLNGLETGTPLLVDATSGRQTGLRILRRLGRGGMSTVFLAERDPKVDGTIPASAPLRVAVKLIQPATFRQLAQLGVNAEEFVRKEALALYKVNGRTANVIQLFGDGHAEIVIRGQPIMLPWLALEVIEGASLEERAGNVDPVRAHALIRGICSGVAALHQVGVIHRDIKPANVLVSDTERGEVPKLSDCGIARLVGVQMATIAAASVRYAAPEQLCSVTGESNPLIGPWTDVHALAALVWFVLGGCDWYDVTRGWERGARASLAAAPALHPRFRDDRSLLARLDSVLLRGASMRAPSAAAPSPSMAAIVYERMVAQFHGDARQEDVASFAADLMPLLDEALHPPMSPSPLADTSFATTPSARVRVEELAPEPSGEPFADAGAALVQPDGKVLTRVGARLVYLADGRANAVTLLKELAPLVPQTRWITSGPGGGFALVGARHVLHFARGKQALVPLPARASEVGPIVTAMGHDGELTIVCAATAMTDGPELFRTRDGVSWEGPERLDALNGSARAIAPAAGGVVVGGASHSGRFDRILVAMRSGERTSYAPSLAEEGAVDAVATDGRSEILAAGAGFVVRIADGRRTRHALPISDAPRGICVALGGAAFVVTQRAILRVSGQVDVVHARSPGTPPYVAIGSTAAGVCAVDTAGGRTVVTAS